MSHIHWKCGSNGLTERKQQGFPVFVAEEDGIILGLSSIGPFGCQQLYQYFSGKFGACGSTCTGEKELENY